MAEAKKRKTKYRALVGINVRDHRAEPGDVIDWLPERSISWLLEQGFIERVLSRAEVMKEGDE